MSKIVDQIYFWSGVLAVAGACVTVAGASLIVAWGWAEWFMFKHGLEGLFLYLA